MARVQWVKSDDFNTKLLQIQLRHTKMTIFSGRFSRTFEFRRKTCQSKTCQKWENLPDLVMVCQKLQNYCEEPKRIAAPC
jgi:hypothetical protein